MQFEGLIGTAVREITQTLHVRQGNAVKVRHNGSHSEMKVGYGYRVGCGLQGPGNKINVALTFRLISSPDLQTNGLGTRLE